MIGSFRVQIEERDEKRRRQAEDAVKRQDKKRKRKNETTEKRQKKNLSVKQAVRTKAVSYTHLITYYLHLGE